MLINALRQPDSQTPDNPTARHPDIQTSRHPDIQTARQPYIHTSIQPYSHTAIQSNSQTARQPDSPTTRQSDRKQSQQGKLASHPKRKLGMVMPPDIKLSLHAISLGTTNRAMTSATPDYTIACINATHTATSQTSHPHTTH